MGELIDLVRYMYAVNRELTIRRRLLKHRSRMVDLYLRKEMKAYRMKEAGEWQERMRQHICRFLQEARADGKKG